MSMKSSPPIVAADAGGGGGIPPAPASANRSSVASSAFGCFVFVSINPRSSSPFSRHLLSPTLSHICVNRIAVIFHPRAALDRLAFRHEHVEDRVGPVAVIYAHLQEPPRVGTERGFP